MPARPQSQLSEWYRHVYAFTDRQQRLFTVVNVPHDMRLPSGPDPNFETNKTYRDMLQPQYAANAIPEAAFLTRQVPATDSLLSCVAAEALEPESYSGGYRVPESIQNSWIELERGLTFICRVLLRGLGSQVLSSVICYPSWPKPSERNFRGIHPHYKAAQGVARCTRTSLLFLAARCSMILAFWEHERPTPSTRSTPAWLAELEKAKVPSSWRDAIQQSVVANFSAGLRVGAVFQVGISHWFQLIPVLRTSGAPVFFHWQSPQDITFIKTTYTYLSDLAAAAEGDRFLACQLPPTHNRPPVYRLVRNGVTRNHPDAAVMPHETPRGPYQHPEESREAFISRRKKLSADLQQHQDASASARRRQREHQARWDPLPRSLSGVYVWTSVRQAYPHYPEKWHALEIRVPVPGHAVLGLWRSVAESDRSYNSFFDEWDLWLRADEDGEEEKIISAALHSAAPTSTSTSLSYTQPAGPEEPELTPTELGELESLQPLPADNVGTPPSNLDCMELWYGVRPTSQFFKGVDYDIYQDQVQFIFGRPFAAMPPDPVRLKSLSGWVWALTTHQLKSVALTETWDLSVSSRHFLPKTILAGRVRLHEHTWMDAGVKRALYDITFNGDPTDMGWQLVTGATAAVFLLRHTDIVYSQSAAFILLTYGIPFHTVTISTPPRPPSPSILRRNCFVPYRAKSFVPTARDYSDYVQRVLEVVRRPQGIAGLRMGGIVWRLLTEALGDDIDLRSRLLQQASHGPSGEHSVYQRVLQISPSFCFVDDGLSEEELDMVSGVYKVYTDQLNQTADVSWWPKHNHWANNAGQNTGIWTYWNEKWFRDRLQAIRNGTEGPKTSSEWKTALKGHREVKTMSNLVESATIDIIHDYLL